MCEILLKLKTGSSQPDHRADAGAEVNNARQICPGSKQNNQQKRLFHQIQDIGQTISEVRIVLWMNELYPTNGRSC
jgi:hypothetical protein